MDAAPPEPRPLTLPELESALRGQNHKSVPPDLQCLVAANFPAVLHCACRSPAGLPLALSHACSAVLKSANRAFLSRVLRAPGFAGCIAAFVRGLARHPAEAQSLFFAHLALLIQHSKGEFWQIVAPAEFEGYLAEAIGVDACRTFAEAFVRGLAGGADGGPTPLSIARQIVRQIAGRSRNAAPGILLVRALLDCDRLAAPLGGALYGYIDQIATETMRERDAKGVDFLTTLYATAVQCRHIPAWVRIGDAIAAHYTQICRMLTGAARFGQFESAAGKLFLRISSDRMYLSDAVCQVVRWSLGLLFKAPSNSFLHNFVVSAVKLLADDRDALSEVIKQTGLVGQIIENYRNRQWDGRAFWGQLRTLSGIISPCVNSHEYPDWECVVAKSNNQVDEVVRGDKQLFRSLPCLPFVSLLDSPTAAKFAIWVAALFLLLMVYASCAI
jgi:hypothetical protein